MICDIQQACTDKNYFLACITPYIQEDIGKISTAYDFAKKYHDGIIRATGDPYLCHLIGTAIILVENNIISTELLCAALLHDTIEDTSVTIEDLKKKFGEEIAEIVEGLTKISKDTFMNTGNFDYNSYNSENLKKIILAGLKDVRILFIKLADRLDNMRTLHVFREDKRKRIAEKTLHIYAPIAEKIGLYKIKSELEDLAFKNSRPNVYAFIEKSIELTKEQREAKTAEIVSIIKNILDKEHIDAEVLGRAKHYYSIYKKVIGENKDFEHIYDMYGIRIITHSKELCYTIQKVLHTHWEIQIDARNGEPRYKDFIKNPKPNGYQSIHSNFIVTDRIIEVQIRTKEMDDYAESGIAKHWKYKKNERDKKLDKKIDILRQVVAWIIRSPKQQIDIDVFQGEIICITPKGDPIIIKEGATVLDFAYAIHSNVGNYFEKAEVNGESVPIHYKLHNGDIVSIITSKIARVNKQWFTHVCTSEAKNKIKQALTIPNASTTKKKSTSISEKEDTNTIITGKYIEVIGKKAPLKISKCCQPQPGDPIVGYYTKEKSITVHHKQCPDRFAAKGKEAQVQWVHEKKGDMYIRITSKDTPGILAFILDTCMDKSLTLTKITSSDKKGTLHIICTISEKKTDAIQKVIDAIKKNQSILEISLAS